MSKIRTLRIFLFFAAASLVGGAVLGILLVKWGLRYPDSFFYPLIEGGEGTTVVRRVQTLVAIALAPWLLKSIGWKGFSDLGMRCPKTQIFRFAGAGYLMGFLCMGILLMISIISGARIIEVDDVAYPWLSILRGVLITGIGIGIIEEILTRGVLFRSLARNISPWSAALLTSILFAYAHFAEIEYSSVFQESIYTGVKASLAGEFVLENNRPIILEFINLALLGIVLCRMVTYAGHIWLAVGFHASAVGMIKTISITTNINRQQERGFLIGHNSGFLDGVLCTLFLGIVLGIIEFGIFRKTQNNQKHEATSEFE